MKRWTFFCCLDLLVKTKRILHIGGEGWWFTLVKSVQNVQNINLTQHKSKLDPLSLRFSGSQKLSVFLRVASEPRNKPHDIPLKILGWFNLKPGGVPSFFSHWKSTIFRWRSCVFLIIQLAIVSYGGKEQCTIRLTGPASSTGYPFLKISIWGRTSFPKKHKNTIPIYKQPVSLIIPKTSIWHLV